MRPPHCGSRDLGSMPAQARTASLLAAAEATHFAGRTAPVQKCVSHLPVSLLKPVEKRTVNGRDGARCDYITAPQSIRLAPASRLTSVNDDFRAGEHIYSACRANAAVVNVERDR